MKSFFPKLFLIYLISLSSCGSKDILEFTPTSNVLTIKNGLLSYHSKPGYSISLYRINYGKEYYKTVKAFNDSRHEWFETLSSFDQNYKMAAKTPIGQKRDSLYEIMTSITKGNAYYILNKNHEFHFALKFRSSISTQKFSAFINQLNMNNNGKNSLEPEFCYSPRDAILIKNKRGIVVACIEICLECNTVKIKPHNEYSPSSSTLDLNERKNQLIKDLVY